MVPSQGNGRQPKLAGGTAFIDVNMWRFRRFMAVKIKLVALYPQYRRHWRRLKLAKLFVQKNARLEIESIYRRRAAHSLAKRLANFGFQVWLVIFSGKSGIILQ
jgi:hypothetical protein